MDLENDTWEVINSYFRDIPNSLVRHHIDSYNDFIQNKIPLILSNTSKNPPIILIDKEDNNITYEINIDYGCKNHDNYKIAKPTIKNYPSGSIRQLYPNEARLKNLTYGADFLYSVEIYFTMKKNGVTILERVPHPNNTSINTTNTTSTNTSSLLEDMYLGKIPIMLKSDLCVLNESSGEMLSQMGEDPYDLGGYFILDGAEKTIISQERKAENIVFLNTVPQTSGSEKYTHFAEVKCVSDEAFSKARTVKVQLERTGPITVRLGQKNPLLKMNNNRDVPLFIMFRALGVESDKEILQYIIGNLQGELAIKMMEILRPSVLDSYILEEKIYDRERAEAYLVKLPSRGQQTDKKGVFSEILKNKVTKLSFLYDTFTEALFPHISSTGNISKAKAFYLGYVVRRLLLLQMGLEKDTDRDSFINKRIDLSGFMMSTLFRDAFDQMIRNVRVRIDEEYRFNYKQYSGENILNLINENNYRKIFSSERFKEHFNNQLKIGNIGEKKGVVQALDRETRNRTIAHLRRVIDYVPNGANTSTARHRLHATQYGCVCPIETPEGKNVGMSKGLAIISHITFGCLTKPIIDFCINKGVEVIDDLVTLEVENLSKIFVNGNWIGCHRNPEELTNIFRLYRRNGLINIFTSISWEKSVNEIKIYTDGGRFVRPLYIIENKNILIQPRHIKEIKAKNLTFTDLVSGFGQRKEEYNYYDCGIKDVNILGLTNFSDNLLSKLQETQAIIEYVDSQEFDTTLLSIGFNISPQSLLKFTHVELHPSMFLSFNAHLLPFTNFNPSIRSIYSSKHVKQGITTYAMNFNNRIDTNSVILNNPEKPLIMCRLHNVLGVDKFGNGQNVFVAVGKYNYNQEDAIVGNQNAIDMGLFNITNYKRYSDNEKKDPKTGEEHHFYNPEYQSEIPEYPEELMPKSRMHYSKIDKYGLPIKGSYLEKNDIVVGKYMKGKNEKGEEEYKDMSIDVKLGGEDSFIDKVYTCQTNEDGDRMVKIRTCKMRPPIMGDKFASRNAQKGTLGIVLKKEDLPYTEDGIVPDLILDPSSYPSRMTISQFIEMLFGNMATELGLFGCYNTFDTVNIEEINDILETKLGLTSMGNRILYNGYTGEQMESTIFTGVLYYERLKLLVDDKINTRVSGERINGVPIPGGAYTVKERQTVAGRANGGGLKIGEMEREALISHGIWGFIKESFIERCDKFIIQVSKSSGEIIIGNPQTGQFYDNISDGMVSYQLAESVSNKNVTNADNIIGLNMYDQKTTDYVQLVVPYTFKVLIQEMQGMCMNVRLNVDYIHELLAKNDESDDMLELSQDEIDAMMEQDQDLENTVELEDEQDLEEEQEEQEEQGGGGNKQDLENPARKQDKQDLEGQEGVYDEDDDDIYGGGTMDENNDELLKESEFNNNKSINGGFQRANLNPDLVMQNQNIQNQNQLHQPNMEVDHSIGGSMEENGKIDLSQYGGVKPEFDIKSRDDDNVIEDVNSKLLGLQTGGMKETFESAKTQGINNILNNNSNNNMNMNNNSQYPMQMQQQPMQNGGLNMSFNGQQSMQQAPMQQQMQHKMQQQFPIQMQQQMQQMQQQFPMQQGGMNNSNNPLNLNNNIKVVSLDTKISDGFFYSGSNNLDPFTNSRK